MFLLTVSKEVSLDLLPFFLVSHYFHPLLTEVKLQCPQELPSLLTLTVSMGVFPRPPSGDNLLRDIQNSMKVVLLTVYYREKIQLKN
jgi:hypothetical protein